MGVPTHPSERKRPTRLPYFYDWNFYAGVIRDPPGSNGNAPRTNRSTAHIELEHRYFVHQLSNFWPQTLSFKMCPPDVDQTGRLPQTWKLLVPRLRQLYDFPSAGREYSRHSTEKIFRANNNWDAWSRLTRTPRAVQCHPPRCCSANHHITTSSMIEAVPPEILGMIVTLPSLSKDDIIAFGLASPTLWPHVLRLIIKDCESATAQWAGAEIANVGNYLTDLPIPFEKDSLFAASVGPVSTFGSMCTARRLNYKAWGEYESVGATPQAQWRAAFHTHREADAARCCNADFLSAVSPIPHAILEKRWVLRNLTTKQHIRCRFDTDTQRVFVETEVVRLTVEDALELSFCWTSGMDYNLSYLGFMHGQWAGHEFDIVLAEEEMPGMEQEGWKDVTEGVVSDAVAVLGRLERRTSSRKMRDAEYELARNGAKYLSFNKE